MGHGELPSLPLAPPHIPPPVPLPPPPPYVPPYAPPIAPLWPPTAPAPPETEGLSVVTFVAILLVLSCCLLACCCWVGRREVSGCLKGCFQCFRDCGECIVYHAGAEGDEHAAGVYRRRRYFELTDLRTLFSEPDRRNHSKRSLSGRSGRSEIMTHTPVRLLRASWLIDEAGKGSALPTRQEIERTTGDPAYLSGEALHQCLLEVEEEASYPKDPSFPGIVVFSHCWHGPDHPDPSGELLREMAAVLEWYMAERARRHGKIAKAVDTTIMSQGIQTARMVNSELTMAQAYSKAADDFGVFIDFGSLYQGPQRSAGEEAAFQYGAQNMDLLYAHAGTQVLRMSKLPTTWDRSYDARGWCTFEMWCSQLVKHWAGTIDLASFGSTAAVATASESGSSISSGSRDTAPLPEFVVAEESLMAKRRSGGTHLTPRRLPRSRNEWAAHPLADTKMLPKLLSAKRRRAPLHPDAFAKLIKTKQFTVPSDCELVSQLYRTVCTVVLGGVTDSLDLKNKSWNRLDFANLGKALALCDQLRGTLRIANCEMTDAGLQALCENMPPSSLPLCTSVDLSGNPVNGLGLLVLANLVSSGFAPNLRSIWVDIRHESDPGVQALRKACSERGIDVNKRGSSPARRRTDAEDWTVTTAFQAV